MTQVAGIKRIFSLLLCLLVVSCAINTDSRTGGLENFLAPPSYKYYNPKRGGPFTLERSVIFIKGLYSKWQLFQNKINEKGIHTYQHDIECAKMLEKAIRQFNWPVLFKEFKAERERLQTELMAADCHPAV